jgi:diguanylate cyclase (GGDEF)-like protein
VLPLLVPAALYAAALAALGWLPWWGTAAAAVVLAGAAAWAFGRAGAPEGSAVATAWPPLHLLLVLTGGLASPLTPLAGAWAFLVGRRARRAAPFLAAGVLALAMGVAWARDGAVDATGAVRLALLLALGVGAVLLAERRRPRAPGETPADAAPLPAADEPEPRTAAEALDDALEVVRAATDAHEAALWRRAGGDPPAARLIGRSAVPDVDAPDPLAALDGHPFGWAIAERMPVHLQRGKRDLPAPWAAEMLLVPVADGDGVLALAYPGVVPPGADAVALRGGSVVTTLLSLLQLRAESANAEARVRAMADAVRKLPGELELGQFARHLAATICQGTGAAGAAVALAPDETGRGRILHVAEGSAEPPTVAEAFGDGDSRMALAAKHATALSYDDLRGERDRLPLLTPGERWVAPPRSAAVVPLMVEGKAIGVVAAWHGRPGRFGPRELDLLRVLCSIAPLPMRSAHKYEALDQRASTDPLTRLPNRSAFEQKLAASSGYFDRYARPFSLLVLDVDHFKGFNDTWGHEAGDRVLQHVAEVIRNTVRDVDLPARLGGEEFVVVLPETGVRAAKEAAERVRRAIEVRGVVWNGRSLSVTVSVGVASVPDCTGVAAEVLGLADAALYRAKEAGRNQVAAAPRIGQSPETGFART